MIPDIISKLNQELTNGIHTEAQTVCLLAGIRKIIEQERQTAPEETARRYGYLSRRVLLSNCAKAAMITPEMIMAFNERMSTLRPEHKDQIAFILSEPRGRQLVLDATWSNPMLITPENIEDVLSKTKETITREATKKHVAELKAVQKTNKSLAAKNDNLEGQMDAIVQAGVVRASKIVNF